MKPLIIVGMHRSNTSLVGKAFKSAGLDIGDNLMKPTISNKEGYFEDVDIVEFEDKIFKSNNTWWYLFKPEEVKKLTYSKSIYSEAEKILSSKFGAKKNVGWKSPRSTIMLPFWKSVCPNARMVMVFRHPALVARSMVKRGDMWKFTKIHPHKIMKAINLWYTYNYMMFEFFKKNKNECMILEMPQLLDASDRIDWINDKIINDWGYSISPIDFGNATNENLLNRKADLLTEFLYSLSKKANELYNKLKESEEEQFNF